MDKAIIGMFLVIVTGAIYQTGTAVAQLNEVVQHQAAKAVAQKTIEAEDCKTILSSMDGVEYCADGSDSAPIAPEKYLPLIAKH